MQNLATAQLDNLTRSHRHEHQNSKRSNTTEYPLHTTNGCHHIN